MLLPASIQLTHAFEEHQNIICNSDVEHHFHEDTLECLLCHLPSETNALFLIYDFELTVKKEAIEPTENYHFLSNHQQLFFSLRGPPTF